MNKFYLADYDVEFGSEKLQTQKIQAVLNICAKNGGAAVFSKGRVRTASLRLYSNTAIILEDGAEIEGSDNCEEYIDYTDTQSMNFYTDRELIPYFDEQTAPIRYRRAIISAFGAENISVIGGKGSKIDGVDCVDPYGEEGFRGPHGLFFSSCKNVVLEGYAVYNAGNFAHQLDNCEGVIMKNVSAFGGQDGAHLNQCRDVTIENCTMQTGDDCIAGINVENLSVRGCYLNTSCDIFRLGGINIQIKNCTMQGVGKYPHRLSLFNGHGFDPPETGRRNTLYVMEFFGSDAVKGSKHCDFTIKDCVVSDVDAFLHYEHGNLSTLHKGATLSKVTLDNVRFMGLLNPSVVIPPDDGSIDITMKNVSAEDRAGNAFSVFPQHKNIKINAL